MSELYFLPKLYDFLCNLIESVRTRQIETMTLPNLFLNAQK